MSSNRMIALGVVAIIHVVIGYALITGLALKVVKKIIAPIEAVQVKDKEIPPEEPPPPPPKDQEIPPYVPPPEVTVQSDSPAPPTISVQNRVETPQPVYVPAPPRAEPAPPAPKPAGLTRGAQPRGNASVITTDDYPDASQRNGEAGTTVVSYTVSVQGRASNCSVTTSSGFPRLDARTCELITKRFRFDPALEAGTPVEATKTQRVTWKLPADR